MDPNETLRLLIEKSNMLLSEDHPGRHEYDLAEEIAQHVLDLNGWITKGGFLPRAWGEPHACGIAELLGRYKEVLANLTATQVRCTALLNENRRLRGVPED